MGIIANTELAVVNASRKFGEPPKYIRQWVVEVDDPSTKTNDISNATGIKFLDRHPEANFARAMNVAVSNYNGSRWHYVVEWTYELSKQENPDPNPLARPDIWKWTTGGLQVPALYYYDDNDQVKPLQNTAKDFFEGITTDISTLQANISSNRATFDYLTARRITNSLNSDVYLGGAAYTWKCSGISAQPAVEVVNEVEVRYWQVEVTLEYRPDGWPLMLPNIGWNYLDGTTKKRVFVVDPDTGERIPASNPQPLDAFGSYTIGGDVDILSRRVHKRIKFNQYFGTPPQP